MRTRHPTPHSRYLLALRSLLLAVALLTLPYLPARAQGYRDKTLDMRSYIDLDHDPFFVWRDFFGQHDLIGYGPYFKFDPASVVYQIHVDFEARTARAEFGGKLVADHDSIERTTSFQADGEVSGSVEARMNIVENGSAWDFEDIGYADVRVHVVQEFLESTGNPRQPFNEITKEDTRTARIAVEFSGMFSQWYGPQKASLSVMDVDDDDDIDFHMGVQNDLPLPAGFMPPPGGAAIPAAPTATTQVGQEEELRVAISAAPKTTEEGAVVFAAQVQGAGGSSLSYSWDINGAYMATTYEPTWAWEDPERGTFDVSVEVSDGRRTAKATIQVALGDARLEDTDGDGVPDDEDACPEEWGLGDDGCPPFSAELGCVPANPKTDDAVSCTVRVLGVREGETIQFLWHLNSALVGTTGNRSWSYGKLEEGTQYLSVQVGGEGRSVDASVALTVDAAPAIEEASEITDDPTAPFDLGLACSPRITTDEMLHCVVSIVRHDSSLGALSVTWVVDGVVGKQEVALDSSSYSLAKLPPGTHVIQAQVVHNATGKARVAVASTQVLAGSNLSPFALGDDARVPPQGQVAAAVGSMSVVGAWLWAEWWLARRNRALDIVRDRVLEEDRQRWFDEVEEVREVEREHKAQLDTLQVAIEKAWKAKYEALLKNAWKNPREEYLVDVMDRHYHEVFRDGKGDPKQMGRLLNMVDRMQRIQRDFDRTNALVKLQGRLRSPALEALVETVHGGWGIAARILTGIFTGGLSEGVWMPLSATTVALDVRSRVLLGGGSGTDAAWAVLKQGTKVLAADYLITKVFQKGAETFKPELKAFKDFMVQETPTFRAMGRWVAGKAAGVGRAAAARAPAAVLRGAGQVWQALTTPLDDIARSALGRTGAQAGARLPVIHQQWSKPVTYLSPPVYHPGFVPNVPVGWVNRLRQLGALSPGLADDVALAMGRALEGSLDIQTNNLLSAGQRFVLTADEAAGLRMVNNSAYRQALGQGLVPRQVRELVNVARDKVVKNAVFAAFEELSPALRGQITRIQFVGTGARPRSAAAISGWTDVDLGVRGAPRAERLLQRGVLDQLQQQGLDAGLADVHVFRGLRPSPAHPVPGGYASHDMVRWIEGDVVGRGRIAVPTDRGGMLFDAHPDVRPTPGYGPLDPAPRWVGTPGHATMDARRLIVQHVAELDSSLGSPTRLDILRSEGKHAGRVWWTQNKGTGAARPDWMPALDRWKADRTLVPDPAEVNRVWERFVEYFHLGDELGGIG
jgi:hypothetical protein